MSEVIRVEDLHKTYRMGDIEVPALRGVNLTIDRGEFIAVMGSSGSGKSTFMNIVGCLDRPTRGEYFLEGEEVSSLSRDQWAHIRNKRIGFVFQGFNLLSRTTALENVELPMMYNGFAGKQRRNRAVEVLSLVGLGERRDHLAVGADALADQPTGNLDSATSAEIMTLFQRLNSGQGITMVVVTHEQDIADYAQRRVMFRDGVIVSDERKDANLKQSEIWSGPKASG